MSHQLSRRDFLKRLGAVGAVSALPSFFNQIDCKNSPGRPNFIVFLADDLGCGDLACYGHPIIQSPNLDRFAQEGMRFTDCHSGGTVCSPSRASLLTGRNPYRVGIYYLTGGGAHLRREEITVATLLRKAGYDTCFVGKWHLGDLEKNPTPGDHGFDHWLATERNAFEGPENPTTFIRNGTPVGQMNGWYCDIIVKEVLSWLNSRPNPDRPFCIFVCSHEPHTPIKPPIKYSSMYDTPKVDSLAKTISYGGVKRDRAKIYDNKKYYYGTITQLDNAFGTLMKGIEKRGLRDNTLVWFTSDNGPERPVDYKDQPGGETPEFVEDQRRCFGTPGPFRGMKRYTYEGGHRIPGIIRWPGHIESGSETDSLVNGTDIMPTLCSLAGVPIPQDRVIDGTSIASMFKGQEPLRKIPAFWMFPARYSGFPHMAMRERDYVILGWFDEKNEDQTWMDFIKSAELKTFELYNLKKDPDQTENLGTKEPSVFSDLRKIMKELWVQVQAEAPIWKNWDSKVINRERVI
jgi:arylsulfatase A